ncbi:hypothetical protein Ahy_B03g063570 isoform B [Arachis hypogaea]|uniref:Uncharacterized protein n=1 Tax=Arachis hypogaea TaxID=3818 RepID=A0A444ZXI0_ARAHY|nr:hypothetical protein Ahy_B03g063570 isoform B [Arachis hypogaea]
MILLWLCQRFIRTVAKSNLHLLNRNVSRIAVEDEFESNYEVVNPNEDDDEVDDTMETNVAEVANALANQHPFEESFFMPHWI